jgi:hypothetical protein
MNMEVMRKYMKPYIYILAGFLVSAFMVACGSNGGGNDGTTNTQQIQCAPGSVFQNGYCVGANGIYQSAGIVGFYSENYRQRNLQLTGNNTEFLRDAMGVCDRNHINGGTADCSAWASGAFDIVMMAPASQSTNLQVTFRAAPRVNPNGSYSYSLPSAGQLAGALLGFPTVNNPSAYLPRLQLNMVVSVTNNYQGFEARGYGDFQTKANRSLIQIQVPQGKLEDPSFAYRIAYRGQIMATGQFIRCGTADCGVSQPIGY